MRKPVFAYAKIKADQPVHPHRLISTFAVRFLDSIIHILAKTTIFKAVLLLWFILITFILFACCMTLWPL